MKIFISVSAVQKKSTIARGLTPAKALSAYNKLAKAILNCMSKVDKAKAAFKARPSMATSTKVMAARKELAVAKKDRLAFLENLKKERTKLPKEGRILIKS